MKIIGEYRELCNNNKYPSIKENISKIEMVNKKQILKYLKEGKKTMAAPSIRRDIFTGNIIRGEYVVMDDGEFAWTSEVTYYVEKYNLILPDKFINHVLNRVEKLNLY